MNKKKHNQWGGKRKKMQLEIYSQKFFRKKQSAFSLPSINVPAQATIKKLGWKRQLTFFFAASSLQGWMFRSAPLLDINGSFVP